MPPRLRKLVLTTHVATSVGWLGAVVAYLALDLAAVTSQDPQTVRAAYLAMDLTVGYAIVPLALASVTVGIINALGTPWGLFRHHWVVVKLLLTIVATGFLLLEAPSVGALAEVAAASADPTALSGGTLVHSVGALLVLLTTTVLSVFKPKGVTRYGWRRQHRSTRRAEPAQSR